MRQERRVLITNRVTGVLPVRSPSRKGINSRASIPQRRSRGPLFSRCVGGPPLERVHIDIEGTVSLLAMDTDYLLHRFLVRIASWAVYSFFTEVRVIGGEHVPANGPIIVYVSLSSVAYDDAFVGCLFRY
jgi:hypothetical protein